MIDSSKKLGVVHDDWRGCVCMTSASRTWRSNCLHRFASGQRTEKACTHYVLTSPRSQSRKTGESTPFRSNNGLRLAVLIVEKNVDRVRSWKEVCKRASPCMRSGDQIVESLRYQRNRSQVCWAQVSQCVRQDLCKTSSAISFRPIVHVTYHLAALE